MSDSPNVRPAPCSSCLRETAHATLHSLAIRDEQFMEEHALIQCRGCGTPSLREATFWYEDERWGEPRYYPSPLSRRLPLWVIALQLGATRDKSAGRIGDFLCEVYEAVRARHYWLAAMGIRAILENVMIAKVGDLGTFAAKLDAFQKAGFISVIGHDSMRAVLDVGDAAIHRLHAPSEEDLNIAMDVLEGVLAPIYSHMDASERLAARTPKRPSRTQPKESP